MKTYGLVKGGRSHGNLIKPGKVRDHAMPLDVSVPRVFGLLVVELVKLALVFIVAACIVVVSIPALVIKPLRPAVELLTALACWLAFGKTL